MDKKYKRQGEREGRMLHFSTLLRLD